MSSPHQSENRNADDERLGEALSSIPLPAASSGMEQRVLRRIHRRRNGSRFLVGGAVALSLFLVFLMGRQFPQNDHQSIGELTQANVDNVPDAEFLLTPPPVDSLDIISNQQSLLLSGLQAFEQEK